MADLRVSDLSRLTSLSKRYWQRRILANEVPGAAYVQMGERRTYLVDADTFQTWWQEQFGPVVIGV